MHLKEGFDFGRWKSGIPFPVDNAQYNGGGEALYVFVPHLPGHKQFHTINEYICSLTSEEWARSHINWAASPYCTLEYFLILSLLTAWAAALRKAFHVSLANGRTWVDSFLTAYYAEDSPYLPVPRFVLPGAIVSAVMDTGRFEFEKLRLSRSSLTAEGLLRNIMVRWNTLIETTSPNSLARNDFSDWISSN